ncbi:hypothetical protein VZT92_011286 [Zoarces viviparus]|uniref:Uncharacterized protein n=1 Tax=Zoarces viviparus TaxID=48416 RepID=A0AAW1FEA0_ZOAVI
MATPWQRGAMATESCSGGGFLMLQFASAFRTEPMQEGERSPELWRLEHRLCIHMETVQTHVLHLNVSQASSIQQNLLSVIFQTPDNNDNQQMSSHDSLL